MSKVLLFIIAFVSLVAISYTAQTNPHTVPFIIGFLHAGCFIGIYIIAFGVAEIE